VPNVTRGGRFSSPDADLQRSTSFGESPARTQPDDQLARAYQASIELYGSFLRDNDDKRDRFVRFYLSVVASATAFAVYSVAHSAETTAPSALFAMTTVAVVFSLVVLIGLLTFNVLLRFRILHTYYVKLMNRNRHGLLKVLAAGDLDTDDTLRRCWREHVDDTLPPFMKRRGLEEALLSFVAILNAFAVACTVGPTIIVYGLALSGHITLWTLYVPIAVVPIIVGLVIWLHFLWMRTALTASDTQYAQDIAALATRPV
jgi:heme/copper-type cytochrome/quinol oxidase subunit 4